MLETTFERLHDLHMKQESSIVTVTKEKYKDLLDLCHFKGANKIAFEDESCKNTAPAIFNIIYTLSKMHGESLFAFFPVDHKIDDLGYFTNILSKVMRFAEKMDKLFLLGSPVSSIDSHLGYIIPNLDAKMAESTSMFAVKGFVEKPDAAKAEELSGLNPLTNMGIFVGKASLFLEGFLGAGLAKRANNLEAKGDSFDKEIIPHIVDKLVVVEYQSTWQDLGVAIGGEELSNQNVDLSGNPPLANQTELV